MRISDWSSDVCSSDLPDPIAADPFSACGFSRKGRRPGRRKRSERADARLRLRSSSGNRLEPAGQTEAAPKSVVGIDNENGGPIGRAAGRERGGQSVSISGVARSLKKKIQNLKTQ